MFCLGISGKFYFKEFIWLDLLFRQIGIFNSFVKNGFEEKKIKGRKYNQEIVEIILKYIGIDKEVVGIERRGWIGSQDGKNRMSLRNIQKGKFLRYDD